MTQTNQVVILVGKVGKILKVLNVMHLGSLSHPAVPLAVLALIAVTAQDRGAFAFPFRCQIKRIRFVLHNSSHTKGTTGDSSRASPEGF
jgi:hypothetical protein